MIGNVMKIVIIQNVVKTKIMMMKKYIIITWN